MKTFKWTEKQKKALRGSIRKWQKIVNGTGDDEGADNCPCCQTFDPSGYFPCKGCPIKEFTGISGCNKTPYDLYEDIESIQSAIVELNFLKAVYLAGGGK